MLKALLQLAACACLILSAAVAPAPASAQPERSGLSQRAQVIDLLNRKMKEGRIPGLQIVVLRDNRIVLNEALGVANVEYAQPVTQDTRFPINSATKSFTGVAVMQLVEAGKLDLDAPIATYLDDLPPAWQAIKLRQLLSHLSGLPNIVDGEGLIGKGGEAEAWAEVYSRPLEAAPGTAFSYNQTNYALLARIITARSGMPFAAFFRMNQFDPAGMSRTVIADSFDVVPDRATPYSYYRRVRGSGEVEGTELSHWIDDLPAFIRTGAGITTSATDLGNWMIALNTGQLLKAPASRDQLWQADAFNSGEPSPWGMGWPVLSTTPRRIVGGLGGGRSAFFVYPDHGLAIIVLTNLVGGNPQRFIDEIAAIYL